MVKAVRRADREAAAVVMKGMNLAVRIADALRKLELVYWEGRVNHQKKDAEFVAKVSDGVVTQEHMDAFSLARSGVRFGRGQCY